MILGILLLNCLGHNCNDIIFKVTCDLHDKCIWDNRCKYPTTTSSSSISYDDTGYSLSSKKKKTSKKYNSEYIPQTSN